jgi:hypothetical protein
MDFKPRKYKINNWRVKKKSKVVFEDPTENEANEIIESLFQLEATIGYNIKE